MEEDKRLQSEQNNIKKIDEESNSSDASNFELDLVSEDKQLENTSLEVTEVSQVNIQGGLEKADEDIEAAKNLTELVANINEKQEQESIKEAIKNANDSLYQQDNQRKWERAKVRGEAITQDFAKRRAESETDFDPKSLDYLDSIASAPDVYFEGSEKNTVMDASGMGMVEDEVLTDVSANGKRRASWITEFIDWIKVIVIALIVGTVLQTFVVSRNLVEGQSMMPTLHEHDQLVVYKLDRFFNLPSRGTIITFYDPREGRTDALVKRVIGLPGDHIVIKNGQVYRNDLLVEEPYLGNGVLTEAAKQGFDDIIVPEKTLYVLGDNRPHSLDSRILGPISLDKYIGEVVFRIYPFDRMKKFEH